MNPKVPIFLPIETINRDLDLRLWLACKFVKPTNRFFIGYHGTIFRLATQMRKGLFVGKHFILRETSPSSPRRDDLSRYRALKEREFLCIHLDEEGGVYIGDEDAWRKQLILFHPGFMASEDYICTWGDFQRDFYQSLDPKCSKNIRTTGHPRFDLYKAAYRSYFEPDAVKLKARYGDFILINGNFTVANNGLGHADTFSLRNLYIAADTARRLYYVDWWANTAHVMMNFIQLINHLSIQFPATNIVVRPHPSEDWQYYEAIFKGVSNVHVVHEGPVTPWLLACKVLIHDGCTTAIEAFLADTNIINYRSIPQMDSLLPNILGVKCFTEGEVIQNVKMMLAAPRNGPPPADFNATAYSLLANFKEDSFGRFMEVMTEAEGRLRGPSKTCGTWRIGLDEKLRGFIDTSKSIVRPLFPEKNMQYKFYSRNHFYGFSQADIERKLLTIGRVLGKPIQYTIYGDKLLSVEVRD